MQKKKKKKKKKKKTDALSGAKRKRECLSRFLSHGKRS